MEEIIKLLETTQKCPYSSIVMVAIDVFVIIMLVSILSNDERKK